MPIVSFTNSDKSFIVDDCDHVRVLSKKWRLNFNGYPVSHEMMVGGRVKTIHAGRFILQPRGSRMVDHADHDPLNCRRNNLRVATRSQNGQNQRKQKRECSSRFKGVREQVNCTRSRWCARITVKSRLLNLGSFPTEQEAAIAYNEAAKRHFGKFAYLNQIL